MRQCRKAYLETFQVTYLESSSYRIDELLLKVRILPDATLEVVQGVVEEGDGLLVELVQVRQMAKYIDQGGVYFWTLQEPEQSDKH